MKDNLIDEERAKQEEAAQESLEQKIDRLGKYKNFDINKKDWKLEFMLLLEKKVLNVPEGS